eukprot:3190792-Rhodomonas_salina.1
MVGAGSRGSSETGSGRNQRHIIGPPRVLYLDTLTSGRRYMVRDFSPSLQTGYHTTPPGIALRRRGVAEVVCDDATVVGAYPNFA